MNSLQYESDLLGMVIGSLEVLTSLHLHVRTMRNHPEQIDKEVNAMDEILSKYIGAYAESIDSRFEQQVNHGKALLRIRERLSPEMFTSILEKDNISPDVAQEYMQMALRRMREVSDVQGDIES